MIKRRRFKRVVNVNAFDVCWISAIHIASRARVVVIISKIFESRTNAGMCVIRIFGVIVLRNGNVHAFDSTRVKF